MARQRGRQQITQREETLTTGLVQRAKPEAQRDWAGESVANFAPQESRFQANLTTVPVQRKPGTPETTVEKGAKRPNHTGLPDNLKAGLEHLSGLNMSDVRVHFNSSKPAQLNALAYTKGTEIHVGPGQERHLSHEGWHVVQQMQGRVKPTIQFKDVAINDDGALEREADMMGARAAQIKEAGRASEISKPVSGTHLGGVMQLYQKLKIGISGTSESVGISAEEIPTNTFVWILSNKKDEADKLDDKGVTAGKDKSTPKQIIEANKENVNNYLLFKAEYRHGYATKGIFQSGVFIVPRNDISSGIDYSFLRFAALESYKLWSVNKGWPQINSNTTLLETIDSDYTGITGDTGKSLLENDKAVGSWLAEAGIYRWDWQDVKENERVNKIFETRDVVNTNLRDAELKNFSEVYTQAETKKREEASDSIFRIYFPEPATRISSYAVDLLSESGFEKMPITRGHQAGFGRESIGLIAALVYLDMQRTKKDESRSKSKLKFNPKYVVTTGLGKRKGHYVNLFINWYLKTKESKSDTDITVFDGLAGVSEFDQSYLNPSIPGQVEGWHTKTLVEMQKKGKDAEAFFHPKA